MSFDPTALLTTVEDQTEIEQARQNAEKVRGRTGYASPILQYFTDSGAEVQDLNLKLLSEQTGSTMNPRNVLGTLNTTARNRNFPARAIPVDDGTVRLVRKPTEGEIKPPQKRGRRRNAENGEAAA